MALISKDEINRAGAMQADSTIWFAAPRLPPLAGLLPDFAGQV